MLKCKTSIWWLFLIFASPAFAASYYVDQTAGNDANDGSIGSPWKNCLGMAGASVHTGAAVLNAGDIVYLDRSDSWSVVNAGGPGFRITAGVHYIGDEWDPESGGVDQAIIAASARCEAGVVRIFDDDLTEVTWVEGIEIDGGGFVHSGFDINHRFWTTGLTDATKRLEDLYVHNCVSDQASGDFRYGIIVSDGSPDATGMVSNVEILNCTVEDCGRDFICLYPGNTGRVTNCLIRGCTAFGPQNDPSYTRGHGILVKGDVQDSIVEWNNCYDTAGSAIFVNGPESGPGPGPTTLTIRHNLCDTDPGSNNGAIRFFGTGTKSADVYGNIILENTVVGGFEMGGNTGALTLNIYNNTLYNCYMDLDGETCTIINNIVVPVSGTAIRNISGPSTLITNLTSTPNFKNTSNLPTAFTGTYPNFTPNNDGLSIESGAAIDLGTDLGSSYNISINSLTRTIDWDIGAYEFVSVPIRFPRVPDRNRRTALIR